jgi:anti-sigma factor RsiW
MSVKEAHPSELDWSKLLAGELGWSAARRLRRHQESCPACRQLAAEMAVERTSFDASPQRAGELALLQGRLAASRLAPRTAPRLHWVFAAKIAAAVAAAIGVRTAPP